MQKVERPLGDESSRSLPSSIACRADVRSSSQMQYISLDSKASCLSTRLPMVGLSRLEPLRRGAGRPARLPSRAFASTPNPSELMQMASERLSSCSELGSDFREAALHSPCRVGADQSFSLPPTVLLLRSGIASSAFTLSALPSTCILTIRRNISTSARFFRDGRPYSLLRSHRERAAGRRTPLADFHLLYHIQE